MTPVRRAFVAALAAAALLAGCTTPPTAPERSQQRETPAEFPKSFYEQATARGEPVYRVDAGQSVVVIEVRRGGPLARLGHDHVVAAHNVTGYVAPGSNRADLYIALDELAVDEPALRKAAGFDTQPTESDIAGTRANMLEKVLETQRFPHVIARVNGADGKLAVTLTLHGVTRTLEVPGKIEKDDKQINVIGRLAFNQSDFGITPFSILGGAVAVQDRLELRFEIRAVSATR